MPVHFYMLSLYLTPRQKGALLKKSFWEGWGRILQEVKTVFSGHFTVWGPWVQAC